VQASPPKLRLKRWVARLMRLYRELPALHREDDSKASFAWLDAGASSGCIFAWRRSAAAASDVLVVVNLSAGSAQGYQVPASAGRWRCVARTALADADDAGEPEELAVEVAPGDAKLTVDLGAFSAQVWLAPGPESLAALRLELRRPGAAGGELRVVGSCPELGDWRPEAGAVLQNSADTPELWLGEVRLPPSRGRVELKFIALPAGGGVEWEPIEGNREVVLTGGGEVSVSAEFGRR